MFENVDGRTDDGFTGILIAHLGALGSGELKIQKMFIVADLVSLTEKRNVQNVQKFKML